MNEDCVDLVCEKANWEVNLYMYKQEVGMLLKFAQKEYSIDRNLRLG